MYIFTAFLSPLFHSFTNLLDEKIDKGIGGHPVSCTFFTILVSCIFTVPFYFLFDIRFPDSQTLLFLLPIGFINVIYLIPYYKSLLISDTSVVASLFSLNRVFTLFFAFIFLGETLSWLQALGFIIIIASCFLLTFDWKKKHPKKVLFYMTLSAGIISVEAILYKFSLDKIPWYEAFFWASVFVFLINLLQLLIPTTRRVITKDFSKFIKTSKYVVAEELCSFLGAMTYVFSLSYISVFVMKAVDSVQPFFVIFSALLLKFFFNTKIHENTHLKNIEKKLFLFVCILVGVYLVIK